MRISIMGFLIALAGSAPDLATAEGASLIEKAHLSTPVFDPSTEESVSIEYQLADKANIAIEILDPSHRVLRRGEFKNQPKGTNHWEWDGKDSQGRVVPDEAYTFVLTAETGGFSEVLDPRATSGGLLVDLEAPRYDYDARRLIFRLRQPARVWLRAGIKDGALLETIRDWAALPPGENLVYWTGQVGEWDYLRMRDLEFRADAWTLSDLTVLSFGNVAVPYSDYLATTSYEKRLPPPRNDGSGPIIARSRLPVEALWAPSFAVSFPYLKNDGAKIIKLEGDESLVRIEAGSPWIHHFLGSLFEIVMVVDGDLVAEEGDGYLPYNWPWNHSMLAPGRHLLTVNLANFAGQIGSRSVVVEVGTPAVQQSANSGGKAP